MMYTISCEAFIYLRAIGAQIEIVYSNYNINLTTRYSKFTFTFAGIKDIFLQFRPE